MLCRDLRRSGDWRPICWTPRHLTTERCSVRVDVESWLRCPARGSVERLPGTHPTPQITKRVCVSHPLSLSMLSTAIRQQHTERTRDQASFSSAGSPSLVGEPVHQPLNESASSRQMNPERRTVLWVPWTRLSSLTCGYCEKSEQQRSSVRTFRRGFTALVYLRSPGASSMTGAAPFCIWPPQQ